MNTLELARRLAFVAGDLETRGYPYAGLVRQAARMLLEMPAPWSAAASCRCGARIAYAGRGRPRIWCSERCRRRARP